MGGEHWMPSYIRRALGVASLHKRLSEPASLSSHKRLLYQDMKSPKLCGLALQQDQFSLDLPIIACTWWSRSSRSVRTLFRSCRLIAAFCDHL